MSECCAGWLRTNWAARAAGAVITAVTATVGLVGTSAAQDASGMSDWQMTFQEPHSEVMRDIVWFGNFTLILMTGIVLFVTALLAYVIVKFNAKANPVPSKTSHNTTIEVVWTVVPILILVIIAIPSFRLLYKQLEIPENAITIKATGYQWFWEYDYPDHGGINLVSYMLTDEEQRQEKADAWNAEIDQYPRLLAVDYDMVVPVNTPVRVQVIAEDVMHAYALPAFGVKIDAIPGRLNETWFIAEKEGIYYGQCSELCGTNHAFMPIGVRVVSQEQFDAWTAAAAEDVDTANEQLAAALAEDGNKLAQR